MCVCLRVRVYVCVSVHVGKCTCGSIPSAGQGLVIRQTLFICKLLLVFHFSLVPDVLPFIRESSVVLAFPVTCIVSTAQIAQSQIRDLHCVELQIADPFHVPITVSHVRCSLFHFLTTASRGRAIDVVVNKKQFPGGEFRSFQSKAIRVFGQGHFREGIPSRKKRKKGCIES